LKNHEAGRSVFSKIPPDSIDIIYKQWRMRVSVMLHPTFQEMHIFFTSVCIFDKKDCKLVFFLAPQHFKG